MKKCGDFGGETARGNPCERDAAWGRDASTGPCKYHHQAARRPTNDGLGPAPPSSLSEQAAEVWRAVTDVYVFGLEELLALQGALEHWDIYREARAQLQVEGPVVENPSSGARKRHPAALVARDAFRAYRKSIQELGVTSLSEADEVEGEEDGEDPLAAHFRNRDTEAIRAASER